MPPDFISQSSLWGPLFAVMIFAALVLLAALIQVGIGFVVRHRERTAPEALGVLVLAAVRGPAVMFLLVLGLFLGVLVLTRLESPAFDVMDGWDEWVRSGWVVVVILQASHLASKLGTILMGWYVQRISGQTALTVGDKLLPPIRRILPIAVYSVGLLVAMATLEIAISPLLAGFGIGGLAVALAVQPTLSNFFSGTYLVTEGEVKEGDYIELEGGPAGYVVDVGWRSTKIRSRYNNLVMIPNSKMADTIVTNYFSPTPALNVIITCGVSYQEDLAHVERVVLDVCRKVMQESPDAAKDSEPFFGFWEFGESNIDFWIFVQANDRSGSFTLRSEIIKAMHARFNEEGIEINYPVRKLVHPAANGMPPIPETT